MLDITATYTDQYELAMGQAYFLEGRKDQHSIFDYSFRKMPFTGGYVVFAGLLDLLTILENLRFDQKDMEFFKAQDFHPDYLAYLEAFRFTGSLYSPPEGDLVFPTRPIVRVEGNIIEVQIIETLLHKVMAHGKIIYDAPSLSKTANYCRECLEMLPEEYKRLENPHIYKVGISGKLKELRDGLIAEHKEG